MLYFFIEEETRRSQRLASSKDIYNDTLRIPGTSNRTTRPVSVSKDIYNDTLRILMLAATRVAMIGLLFNFQLEGISEMAGQASSW